jgi:3-hydroxyacyl-CoA dehydrogenase/enoyl-CoA hydratase/3-hydroxybutyryl-CoA epimerase
VPPDLTERLMFRLFNECVACLREGVVADKDLLDTGVIFGTGFAPFRGGPMNYLTRQGAGVMQSRLTELADLYGSRFAADAGWKNL